ncbi:MarR family winged helix-turn-helix transcriptional regulator [Roseomonas sp. NAR14]|uniref:MarR family winged helix-turn-helix transcriptional regulator n=1 Tax=Roseomonas acroporae TaxID=2937791 RepID=A0A9X1Y711_9PROT|nr:MarR family winged helix-turn-helix transcriptional regulator [Roseomonas acroporae]MCK8784298.1 MarR family winged helix-turn-helix transcriptional regulator [Roseomonas acroporae]
MARSTTRHRTAIRQPTGDQPGSGDPVGMATRPPAAVPEGAAALEGYDFAQQIGYLLRRAYQRHLAIFQRLSADPHLTSVQFVTLCALHDLGPGTQTDLIRATGIDQATIRGIIERLRRRGLLAALADAGDRRKVILSLTPAGRALLSAMIPSVRRITEETLGPLNPAERMAALYTLRRMIEAGGEG